MARGEGVRSPAPRSFACLTWPLAVLVVISLIVGACGSRRAVDADHSAPLTSQAEARRTKMPGDNRSRSGFADYHAHMFSDRSFGQFIFSGKAYPDDPSSPDAMARALAPCEHTSLRHAITRVAVEAVGEPCHGSDGYPAFKTWPTYNTHAHQQMYIDWVYRTYQYDLRLLTIVVTNNQTLCELVHHPGPCNDMQVVDAQLAEIKRMAAFEHDWMQVAHSAAEADAIIASNKLAIVIGIEIDTLFDCSITKDRHCSCTTAQVRDRLAQYHDLGVRQINPIHMADNGFGGNALYKEVLATSAFHLRKYYADYYDCFDQGVRWTLQGSKAVPPAAQLVSLLTKGRVYCPKISNFKAEGHCNALGLTSECGAPLIQEMMRRGMLIDLEHMSQRSVDDTLAIAESVHYPPMLSHTWLRDLKLSRERVHFSRFDRTDRDSPWDEQKSEMHRSEDTIRRIKALGGVIGLVTNQGPIEIPPTLSSFAIANNCDGSSKSFAQAFLDAASMMGHEGSVGFGTDFNGLAGQPGPRFGPNACSGEKIDARKRTAQVAAQKAEGIRVLYDGSMTVGGLPLTRSQAGDRRFDFNEDGLAHYGLLPDLIADLQALGLPHDAEQMLFRSAAAYVDMWRRAETVGAGLGRD